MNAIDLLRKDHRMVEDLFKRYESLDGSDPAEKMTVFDEIHRAIALHTRLEFDVFYPAYRQVYRPDGISPDEAIDQHREMERLFDRLEKIEAGSREFDAAMRELREIVDHHFREEETEMFPSARDRMGDDMLSDLGEKLQEARRRFAGETTFRKTA